MDVHVSVRFAVGRKARRANEVASGLQIRAKLFPEHHLAGRGIDLVDLAGPLRSPRREQIQRIAVGAKTDYGVLRIDSGNEKQAAAIHGPDGQLAAGVSDRDSLAIRRQRSSEDTLWRNGLGFSIAHVNHVVAAAMPSLNSSGEQLFAVRKIAHGAIENIVVSQLPGLAGSCGDEN